MTWSPPPHLFLSDDSLPRIRLTKRDRNFSRRGRWSYGHHFQEEEAIILCWVLALHLHMYIHCQFPFHPPRRSQPGIPGLIHPACWRSTTWRSGGKRIHSSWWFQFSVLLCGETPHVGISLFLISIHFRFILPPTEALGGQLWNSQFSDWYLHSPILWLTKSCCRDLSHT